ncbi:flavin prenyltransferase UbiX [Bacterioplanoides sp. SCSIO 12839]|uniref:flavin prenyltransferase UbiX n=1 Tax=Bacterioplanoides sp. SCSIO 12839 TaxID=2829569 RepID=UPI00210747BD|nr:flavin prenyltransferase UbiX [Bacterioplanoides sp. SCSIO 12839]UTW47518.1 UbiX family flavin prenyltransferase [Bacterioplanoides sp. SCSIO 12839]
MTDVIQERICVAITGASGSLYALRLIEVLVKAGKPVDVIISKAAQLVFATEVNLAIPAKPQAQAEFLAKHFAVDANLVRAFGREDWMAPWASGSGQPGPVVVCPCSTGTLSAIATGASNNLIERAADVALKERRQLILVPRETPYSEIHLQNMLSLTRMGAVILPASPGFYHQPETIEQLIDFVVARILNQLNISQQLMPAWGKDNDHQESNV